MSTQHFSENKTAKMTSWGALTSQLSTDDYIDVVPDPIDVAFFRSKTFIFTATDENLLINILGSIDGGANFDQTVEADLSVTTSASVTKTYTTALTHIKIQVKSATSSTPGTLTGKYFLSWL